LKSVTIITARCRSSRLPNKILKNLSKNIKCIDILIERAKKIKLPIIVATSRNKSDDKLCNYIKKKNYNVLVFRGSSKNKLLRWFNCFKKYNIQKACMIDGDDIFFDFNLYKKQIKKIKEHDMLSSDSSMITGVYTHVIQLSALNKMFKLFNRNIDSEMIEPFILRSRIKRKFIKFDSIFQQKGIRLTLDYSEDLKLIRYLKKKFSITINTKTIINFMKKNKKISNINYFRENFWKKNQLKKIDALNI